MEIKEIKEEIEKEYQFKDELENSIAGLKEKVDKLEKSSRNNKSKSGTATASEEEWKVRYETQVELNAHLEKQIKWLHDKLEKVSIQAQNGIKGLTAFLADLDLDNLSEPELARLAKQLEKDRNALYNELRDTEWKLDKESKAFHGFNEVRKAYMTEINEALMNLEMLHKKQRMLDDAGSVAKCPRQLKYLNISQDERVIDPKKGPISKTAGVRSLPKLDTPDTQES
ncbi:Coiled-coil domain-containing protein 169 [Nymphon striatum]|nr:Coiled-coil domain-containing protein 169 [Nymphon striatum]